MKIISYNHIVLLRRTITSKKKTLFNTINNVQAVMLNIN